MHFGVSLHTSARTFMEYSKVSVHLVSYQQLHFSLVVCCVGGGLLSWAFPYWIPDPTRSGSSSPEEQLQVIVYNHYLNNSCKSFFLLLRSRITSGMHSTTISLPASILVRMVLVHLRNTSSTFSPVRALVSRNDSSVNRQR